MPTHDAHVIPDSANRALDNAQIARGKALFNLALSREVNGQLYKARAAAKKAAAAKK